MQQCISDCIRDNIQEKINRSEFVSLLADESTDIAVLNKLVMYIRVVSEEMKPETLLCGNVHIPDGKSATIFQKMEELCAKHNIDNHKKNWLGF